jgi:hypothetical protein
MFEGEVDRERAAHRTADDVGAIDSQVIEERNQVADS